MPVFKAGPGPAETAGLRDTLAREDGARDAPLVAALGRRDHDAMAELYSRHATAVFDFARCTLGQRPLAEEVVQDVFVQLWRRPERFDPQRGSLRSYLLTLAHGRSVDVIRSETARRRRDEREGRGRAVVAESYDVGWAEADEVHDALAELSPEQRQAIGLAYFLGYSYREVAARLGVPEGTVKNRIRTGLGCLRARLVADQSGVTP
jgi:RNA polymerase sigma-70 factor (ECF subfamily)